MRPRLGARGYTLLELLVVMLLLGLMMGLVAPRASQWLEAAQMRGWRADLRARIETLPVKAFTAGEPLSFDAMQLQQGLPGQPGGVKLQLDAPLRYSRAGMASGGRLELVQGTRREVWRIRPVSGQVVLESPGGAIP